jgi:hypothetical protein
MFALRRPPEGTGVVNYIGHNVTMEIDLLRIKESLSLLNIS